MSEIVYDENDLTIYSPDDDNEIEIIINNHLESLTKYINYNELKRVIKKIDMILNKNHSEIRSE